MDSLEDFEAPGFQQAPAIAQDDELIRLVDPRTNVAANDGRAQLLRQGAQQVQPRVEPASSFSNTQWVWNFQPPSTTTIVSRSWRVKAYVRVTAVGGPFQIGLNDSPKQFPVTAITDTIQLSINGSNVSVQLDHANALLTMNNTPQDRQKYWTATPSMPTQFQNYDDWQTFGSGRNALGGYGEALSEETRGGFPAAEVTPNQVYDYEFVEPILLEPLTQLGEDEGFVNVNQFSLNLILRSPLSLLWSHAPHEDDTLTNVTVAFTRPPELLFDQFTPLPLQHIPQRQIFGYVQPQLFRKTIGTISGTPPANVAPNFSSDTLRLGMVPRHIVVFAQRTRNTQTFLTTQNFAGISNISVQWDNQASLLSTASQQELWQMSARNGSNLTWSQWSKYRGAVAIISLPGDIGLPQDLTSGTVGQFSIQIQASFVNLTGDSADYEMFVVLMNEGVTTIVPNGANFTLGLTTRQQVLDSARAPEIPPRLHVQLAGGSLFSGIKSFVSKLARGLSKIGLYARTAVPFLAAVSPAHAGLAATVGHAGKISDVLSKDLEPAQVGKKKGGAMLGGRRSGGAAMYGGASAYGGAPSGGAAMNGAMIHPEVWALTGGRPTGGRLVGDPGNMMYGGSPVLQLARGRLQRRYVG